MSTNPGLVEKVALRREWSPRVVFTTTLALVFLCGGVAGALLMDLGVHSRVRTPNFETAQGQTLPFDRMQKELNLTAEQSQQVKSILDDFWKYYRSVLSEGRVRIEQVLTPEQKSKFARMLQEQKGR
jgi:Spy/CpxP family protein refolding chaperone